MKRTHRIELEKLPGFVNASGTLKLQVEAAERVGRDYDKIERLAYPQFESSAQANTVSQVAESQNEMLAKLRPMVEGVLNDPNDPRSKMMRQMLDTLGGLPAMHDVEAIRSDVLMNGSSAEASVRDNGIEVEVDDDLATPIDSAEWLSSNFERLIPGFVEAAKCAYSRLVEEPLEESEAAAYLVDNPSEQDLLNRVRIQSVGIGPERRYVFSLETPCAHLVEHGMYAVFQEDTLVACGEYDVIAEGDADAYSDESDF
ncbi:MAG: hypothetical protein ACTHK7_01180 [Aureliella sp.]